MGHRRVLKLQSDARNRENHMRSLLPGSRPCRATSGRGRRDKRRRAGEEDFCTAPGGSVPKVSVRPLPVRLRGFDILRGLSCRDRLLRSSQRVKKWSSESLLRNLESSARI